MHHSGVYLWACTQLSPPIPTPIPPQPRAISLLNYVALALDLEEGSALNAAANTPLASIAKIAAQSTASRKSKSK
jgi:hypothetical protein